jgi:hypothetical protein
VSTATDNLSTRSSSSEYAGSSVSSLVTPPRITTRSVCGRASSSLNRRAVERDKLHLKSQNLNKPGYHMIGSQGLMKPGAFEVYGSNWIQLVRGPRRAPGNNTRSADAPAV